MPATTKGGPWDFSAVYDLVNSLSVNGAEEHGAPQADTTTTPATSTRQSTGLGDFGPVWEFLHAEEDKKLLERAVDLNSGTDPNGNVQDNGDKSLRTPFHDETYTSDGAAYAETSYAATKNVTWDDQLDVLEASEGPITSYDSISELETPSRPGKEKKQKVPRAERKAAAAAKVTADKAAKAARKALRKKERKSRSDVESEAEIRILKKPSPAKKASVHSRPDTPKSDALNKPRYNLRSKDIISLAPDRDTPTDRKIINSRSATLSTNLAHALKGQAHTRHQGVLDEQISEVPSPTVPEVSKSKKMTSKDPGQGAAGRLPDETSGEEIPRKSASNIRGNAIAIGASTSHLIPASVTPKAQPVPTQNGPKNASGQVPGYLASLTPNNPGKHKRFNVMPKEDRDLHLFLRLVHDFPQDKTWLTKPVHLVDHLAAPKGIHVFVDFSNIWISFMEHLKLLQLNLHQKLPHQNISFDSLVLLLERHRPVSKRVLAGSYPLMPAMTLAKAIGYETNILDKVYKARELTERQKRFQVTNALRKGYSAPTQQGANAVGGSGYASNGNGNTSSGSEICVAPSPAVTSNTNATVTHTAATAIPIPAIPSTTLQQQHWPSPEKWVEQCVDELLHLKMLESIVDSEEPSTMVVATGDAAEAEYSGGFMKMILRALKKGWRVELVAWNKSISARYRDYAFQREWADNGNFRIIELDAYAEYLLDT